MKKVLCLCILALLALGNSLAAQGNFIPARSKWVIQFDNTLFAKTQLFTLLEKNLAIMHDRQNNMFIKEMNIDPARDMVRLTVCGIGATGQDDGVLVVYQGRYDKTTILAHLKKEQTKLVPGKVDGIETCTWPSGGLLCFPQPDILVFCDQAKAAGEIVALFKGKGQSLPATSPLFKSLHDAPAAAFLRAAVLNCSDLAKHAPKTMVLGNAGLAFFLAFEEGKELNCTAAITTESAAVAQNLQQIINGVLAMVRMKTDAPASPETEWLKLVEGVRCAAESNSLKVSFHYPVDKLATLLQAMDKKSAPTKHTGKPKAATKTK
jgi:hypothetical protein